MKLINKYWHVATSTEKYFENYLNMINHIDKNTKLIIENKKYLRIEGSFQSIDMKSKSTLNQNLACWEMLGFIYKINNFEYIKTLDKDTSELELLDFARYSIISPSNDSRILRYRHKTIYLMLIDLDHKIFETRRISRIKVSGNKDDYWEKDELKRLSRNFEKKLLINETYKKIIEIIGDNNV